MAGQFDEGALTKSAIAKLVGLQAADTIGFYGATKVAQAAAITAIGTSAPTTAAFGFTSTQASAMITAVNALIVALQNLGLTA